MKRFTLIYLVSKNEKFDVRNLNSDNFNDLNKFVNEFADDFVHREDFLHFVRAAINGINVIHILEMQNERNRDQKQINEYKQHLITVYEKRGLIRDTTLIENQHSIRPDIVDARRNLRDIKTVYNEQAEVVKDEFNRFKSRIENEKKVLEDEISKLAQHINTMKDESYSLLEQIENRNNNLNDIEENIKSKKDALDEFLRLYSSEYKKIDEYKEIISSGEYAKAKNIISNADKYVDEQRNIYKKLKTENERLKQENEKALELAKDLINKENEVKAIKADYDSQKGSYQMLLDDIKSEQDKYKKLVSYNDQLSISINNLKKREKELKNA